jgi:hypothetical protein
MSRVERWANLAETRACNKREFVTSDEYHSSV